jgi:hypothetical protein
MAEVPAYNYHINLWPEPPGPPTYLCLVLECTYKDATLADMLLHTVAAHGLTAVPTPLAAMNASVLATLTQVAGETDTTAATTLPTEEGPRA